MFVDERAMAKRLLKQLPVPENISDTVFEFGMSLHVGSEMAFNACVQETCRSR
jgi:hypothetical protein